MEQGGGSMEQGGWSMEQGGWSMEQGGWSKDDGAGKVFLLKVGVGRVGESDKWEGMKGV